MEHPEIPLFQNPCLASEPLNCSRLAQAPATWSSAGQLQEQQIAAGSYSSMQGVRERAARLWQ